MRRPTTRSDAAGPVRTCAGCGRRRPQSRLVRLAVGADGALAFGRGPGRGAYLCAEPACAEQALRSRALPRRLRADVAVPEDLPQRLAAMLAGERKRLD